MGPMSKLDHQRFPAIRIRRLPIGHGVECRSGTVMSKKNVSLLFDGQRLIVEEKMNGTSVMFSADGNRFTLLSEDMSIFKPGLTGRYRVPARYALFDIFDTETRKFVSFVEKEDIFRSIRENRVSIANANSFNFFLVPIIAQGCSFKLEDIPQFLEYPSRYAIDPKTGEPTYMEGVVVKPARELYVHEYEELVGKLIRNEYLYGKSGIAVHHRRMPTQRNVINPRYGIGDPNFLGRKTEPRME